MSCNHPDCSAKTAGKRRYCRTHALNKWAIWRHVQRQRELTAAGLPVGHKVCTSCQQLFRFSSGRQQICENCKDAAHVVEAKRNTERMRRRIRRLQPKPVKPPPTAMTADERATDALLRQFLRSTCNTARASA